MAGFYGGPLGRPEAGAARSLRGIVSKSGQPALAGAAAVDFEQAIEPASSRRSTT
jgi:hypothetical protein